MEVGKLRPRDRLGLIQATLGQKQHSHHLLGLHSVTAWGHLLGKRHESGLGALSRGLFLDLALPTRNALDEVKI